MSIVARLGQHRVPRAQERRPVGRRLRRIGLGTFFASIVVNAVLGMYAVLAPGFGDTQGKILLTSLCVTGAVLLALACEPAWERGLLGPVPIAGAVLGVVAFTGAIVGIWSEVESETFGQALGSTFTFAIAGAVASLLALARLSRDHGWVFAVTLGLLALGATLVAGMFWLEDEAGDPYLRGTGVVLIALAAFTVTVPVLHWIDRGALAASAFRAGVVRFCPYCGKELGSQHPGREIACTRCGRDFRVDALPEANLT